MPDNNMPYNTSNVIAISSYLKTSTVQLGSPGPVIPVLINLSPTTGNLWGNG